MEPGIRERVRREFFRAGVRFWAVLSLAPMLLSFVAAGWGVEGAVGVGVCFGVWTAFLGVVTYMTAHRACSTVLFLHEAGRRAHGRVVTKFLLLAAPFCEIKITIPSLAHGPVRVACYGLPSQIRHLRNGDKVAVRFHARKRGENLGFWPVGREPGLPYPEWGRACLAVEEEG